MKIFGRLNIAMAVVIYTPMDRTTRIFVIMLVAMATIPFAYPLLKQFILWTLSIRLDEAGIITFIVIILLQIGIFAIGLHFTQKRNE